ncbi:MAG TPA: pseudouridine synthase, partial [Nitrosospira sp.]|nr:pseudouridine synthase [Nitrosospira sp.]
MGKEFPSRQAVKEIIKEDSDGQRVDNFLIKRLKAVPKSHIYRLLRSGQVRVNSKRVEPGHHLHLGDIVRIPPVTAVEPDSPPAKTRSARIFRHVLFEVLFEDHCLIVINKPSGMAVHGGSGISLGIIEQLRAQHPEWKFLELVHRLDRETSGVLLLAKTRTALVELHRQIREGVVGKQYLTLVKGEWQNARQSVRLPLNKFVTLAGERRVAVVTGTKVEKPMAAHTVFVLKRRFQDFSLLQAE